MSDDLTYTNEHLTNREVTLVRAFLIMNLMNDGSPHDRCQGLVECYYQLKKVDVGGNILWI